MIAHVEHGSRMNIFICCVRNSFFILAITADIISLSLWHIWLLFRPRTIDVCIHAMKNWKETVWMGVAKWGICLSISNVIVNVIGNDYIEMLIEVHQVPMTNLFHNVICKMPAILSQSGKCQSIALWSRCMQAPHDMNNDRPANIMHVMAKMVKQIRWAPWQKYQWINCLVIRFCDQILLASAKWILYALL